MPAGLMKESNSTLGNRVSGRNSRSVVEGRFLAKALARPIISPRSLLPSPHVTGSGVCSDNTVSADGSISGVYSASLRLAEQGCSAGSNWRNEEITNGLKAL